MGRLWVALALLVALVSTATAKPACACRTEVILPKAGATGIPTNARFWDIPASGRTSTPDQRIQSYELAPHTTYELSSPHLSLRFAAVAMRDSDLRGYLWIASAAIATFVFVTAAGWDAASKVLRFAGYDGATATIRGDEVRVTVGGKEALLRAAPWRVDRARRHAIPRAVID